jgi:predicted anti-sigma-YlaC factor YlaD
MLTCSYYRSALSDELDGELRGPRRWLVRAHLFICPRCRRVNASLRQTVSVLHEMGEESEGQKPGAKG